MPARKLSVSLPEDLAEAAQAAAAADGSNLSAWLAQTVREKLAADHAVDVGYRAALDLVIEYEAQHGPIPDEAEHWADEALAAAGLTERYRQAVANQRAVG